MTDKLILGGHEFTSRFILGSGKYSLDLINAAVQNAGAEIITLALRRANQGGTANILDYIPAYPSSIESVVSIEDFSPVKIRSAERMPTRFRVHGPDRQGRPRGLPRWPS